MDGPDDLPERYFWIVHVCQNWILVGAAVLSVSLASAGCSVGRMGSSWYEGPEMKPVWTEFMQMGKKVTDWGAHLRCY